jgi:hypothetical protein
MSKKERLRLWREWSHVRDEVSSGVTVRFQDPTAANPGIFMAIAVTPSSVVPVGVVWYSFIDKSTISVQYSWTIEWARRLGVRTALHAALVSEYSRYRIVTGGANSKASRKWLRKNGFRDQGDRYVWERRQPD